MNTPALITPESLAPMHGSLDFQRLPLKERERLSVLVPVLVALENAKPVGAALARAAADLAHLPWAPTAKTLENHLRVWRDRRDWRNHIDKRCAKELQRIAPEAAANRSPEFLAYWGALCEDYKRAIAPAQRELRRRWKSGLPIPGYGTWRDWFALAHPGAPVPAMCPGYPDGWDERTLYRLAPSKTQLALARDGFKRRAELTAYTPRTTRNLRPMELLVADDMRLDFLVVLPRPVTVGGRTFAEGVHELIGMVLIDVASRKIIGWCLRPAAKDEEGVKAVMCRDDLALLTANALLEYGLPSEYPVEFYTEHATATFTNEARGWMKSIFGDRVRFRSTGLFDNVLAEYGYAEGGGKPWHKGWVEAAFPRMHNELAAMRGQIGANYTKKPGDADARRRAAENLLKAAAKVSDRAANLIKYPYPTYAEALERFARLMDETDARTDHHLEGFEPVMQWRLTEAEVWREDMSELALLPRDQVLSAQYETRMQSPAEKWAMQRAAGKWAPVDMAAVAPLMSRAESVTVRRGMIRIERDKVAHHFFAPSHELLREGAQWVSHWSWLHPEAIHLYHAGSLAYAGSVPRLDRVDVMDKPALAESARNIRLSLDTDVAEYRSRHVGEAVRIATERTHNAAVLRGEYEPERIADRLRNADREPVDAAPTKSLRLRAGTKPRGIEDL